MMNHKNNTVKILGMLWKQNRTVYTKIVKINRKINFIIKDFHLLIQFKISILRNQIRIQVIQNLGEQISELIRI